MIRLALLPFLYPALSLPPSTLFLIVKVLRASAEHKLYQSRVIFQEGVEPLVYMCARARPPARHQIQSFPLPLFFADRSTHSCIVSRAGCRHPIQRIDPFFFYPSSPNLLRDEGDDESERGVIGKKKDRILDL